MCVGYVFESCFFGRNGLTDFYDILKVASFSMLSVPKIIEIG